MLRLPSHLVLGVISFAPPQAMNVVLMDRSSGLHCPAGPGFGSVILLSVFLLYSFHLNTSLFDLVPCGDAFHLYLEFSESRFGCGHEVGC
jgi:hypothetical protein